MDDVIRTKPARTILSAMLDRYDAVDLIGALALEVRHHRNVKNQNALADALERVEQDFA